ncbi:hypothetical protein GCM10009575_052050 [Streptomyces rhizosphaericus]|uniref:PucR C-terminal helix-turn-helix domain-containing protein n=1 Tax=Streptomyces rhizosphaericus TaxID=114699 RepID=A0ABN1Q7P2_9ACTN
MALPLPRAPRPLPGWVPSPPARGIAGPPAAGSAAEPPAAVRAQLAAEQLAARGEGRRGPHRLTAADGMTYSLFTVRSGDPGDDVRETVLSDWVLAVGADADEWPEERLDLLYGVTQLIAVERDRRNASRTVRRRLAQEVLELVQSGAPPAEIAARLRVAAPVLLPGLGTAPHWQVVVARVEWGVTAERERGGDGGARGGGDGGTLLGSGRKGADGGAREGAARNGATGATWDESARDRGAREGSSPDGRGVPGGVPGGPVAQSLLEEILVDPYATGPEPSDRIAVAHTADEAVALAPLPALGDGPSDGATDHPDTEGVQADTLLAAVREPLARGLAGDGRLTLGVSAAVHSADGLRGALEEARHARRVAAARPGRVCAAGHQELASHVLLLPFVPDDVRRAFTARLLDPLREYDLRHRAELIPTLEAFLDCDGSWTRCAARLHLHVNTLRYRIGRIEQLTGRELSRLEDKLDFFLALRMS